MGMFSDIDYSLIVLQLEKAMANGVATLDSNTKVPKAQISLTASDVGAIASTGNEVLTSLNAASGTISSGLLPSYVDDVLSYTNLAGFPGTGEAGKIYVDETTNKVYRWSGSVYVEISSSATAGEALKLTTPRTITTTGDASYSVSFDGSANVTSAITLATVNSNAGSFGSASSIPAITVNAKGQVTAVSTNSIGNELIALQSLSDTPGFLKKTGNGTYSIDINSYLSLAGGTITGDLVSTSATVSTSPTTGAIRGASLGITGAVNAYTVSASELTVSSIYPAIWLNESKAPTNKKSWYLVVDGEALQFQTRDDNGNYLGGPLTVSRAGTITTTDMIVSAATPSTSPTTGASRVTGGQGVQGNQYVGGFSSLGGDANHPGIKIKVLTGTTAATQGGLAAYAHHVASTKVVSVYVMVKSASAEPISSGELIPSGHQQRPGCQFDFLENGMAGVFIYNHPTNSYNILSKPLTITVIYTA